MKYADQIEVGQRWRSRDKRDNGRTVTVLRYSPRMNGDGAVLVATTARRSTMRETTLRTRYELTTPTQPATDREGGE